MSDSDSLLDRRTLLDVLVNVIPVGILLFFTVLFLVYGSYPSDPVVTVVQVALILVPIIIVVVITYYAARAVRRDERAGGAEIPPGYSRADAEISPADDDD